MTEDLAWKDVVARSETIAEELGPEWQPEPLRPQHPETLSRAAATRGRWWVIHQPSADVDKFPERAYCAIARGYAGEGPTPRAAVERCRAVILRVLAEIASLGAEIDP